MSPNVSHFFHHSLLSDTKRVLPKKIQPKEKTGVADRINIIMLISGCFSTLVGFRIFKGCVWCLSHLEHHSGLDVSGLMVPW